MTCTLRGNRPGTDRAFPGPDLASTLGELFFHAADLAFDGLRAIGPGTQVDGAGYPWHAHAVNHFVALPDCGHHLVPGPLDRGSVGMKVRGQAGGLDHPLTGGNLGRNGHTDAHGHHAEV